MVLWLVVYRIDRFALVRTNDIHFGLYFAHQLSFFFLLFLVLFGLHDGKINVLAGLFLKKLEEKKTYLYFVNQFGTSRC